MAKVHRSERSMPGETPDDFREDPAPNRTDEATRNPRVRFIGETYRLLFEKNPLPMWVFDLKSLYFLAVNDAAVEHYGYSRNEFLRMTVKDIRPAEDVPALLANLGRMDSATESIGVWRHLKRDGTLIDVEVRGNEIDFEGHRARFILAEDVTERLRSERRLRTEFAVTRALLESSSFAEAVPRLLRAVCEGANWEYGELWKTSPDGAALRWAGAWHVPEFPSQDLEAASHTIAIRRGIGIPGTTWATGQPEWVERLTSDSDFQRARPAAALQLRQALSFPISGRGRRVLGVMVFFSRTAREPDPTFLDLMADLGDRMGQFMEGEAVEAERHRLEERFTKAFHANPGAAAITRLEDGKIIDVNANFLRAFEYTREEVLGRTTRELNLWMEPGQRERVLGPLFRNEPVMGREEMFRAKSGRTWTALVFADRITISDEPTILTTLVDVTSLREAQQRLLETEQLAAIGRTAGFVAHELNTPLTNIALLTASLRRQMPDAALLDRLDRIDAQRRVAAKIIEEVLSFTRSTDLRKAETDLGGLLRTAADQAVSYRASEVSLQLDVDRDPVMASVDPLKMSQVFVNLIKNAFQATERGTVAVSLRREPGDAVVAIRDTGKGMSPTERDRLFQPFFTTKRRGEGVGLGLTFTKAVVDAHGGRIDVTTEPGQGTTFVVRLPLAGTQAPG